MNLPIYIAKRYLFAKKTHNVINIISYISVAGVALGTFALIVVLSVSNGFNQLIKSLYTAFDSDIRITAVEGKTFDPTTETFAQLKKLDGVISYSEVVEDNVLLSYQSHPKINETDREYSPRQYVAVMKGVSSSYRQTSGIDSLILQGDFELRMNSIQQTVLGLGVVEKLGLTLGFVTPLEVWVPKKGKKITTGNPLDNMRHDYLYPSGIFAVEKNIDSKYFYTTIDFARELLGYTTEATAIELRLGKDVNTSKVQQQIEQLLGSEFSVKNRFQQNETLYRLMTSEKVAIYFILLFLAIIMSFNIIGSLTMLMVDKKKDIETLQSIGADTRLIKRIFLIEGWMISLVGAGVGLVLGVLTCLAQQHFKLIGMPGGFIIDAYPVDLQLVDIVVVATLIVTIGYFIAKLPVAYMAKRLRT